MLDSLTGQHRSMPLTIDPLPLATYKPLTSRILLAAHRMPDFPMRLRLIKYAESALGRRRIIAPGTYGERFAVDSSDLVQRSLLLSGAFEPEVQAALRLATPPGAICVDIGANVGAMSLCLAIHRRNQVVAFEADPAISNILRVNRDLSGISEAQYRIEQCAISDTCGETTYYRAPSTNIGRGGLFLDKGVDAVSVKTVTLDAYFSKHSLQSPMTWKMDIEGGELNALKGGIELLRTRIVAAIIFEEHVHTIEESKVAAFLVDFGYRIDIIEGGQHANYSNFIATLSKKDVASA